MAVMFDNLVSVVIPGYGSWQTVDVSASAPLASGVMLIVRDVGAGGPGGPYFGVRKTGSTDSITERLYSSQRGFFIGVDGTGHFDVWAGNTDITLYLAGYFTTDAVFFDNLYDYTPASAGSWQTQTLDEVASGAVGAFMYCKLDSVAGWTFGLRKNGSTYNEPQLLRFITGAFVGLDSSKRCQVYCSSISTVTIGLVGYLKQGYGYAPTNEVVHNNSVSGTYETLSELSSLAPQNAAGVVFHATNVDNEPFSYALRSTSSSDDFYDNAGSHTWYPVSFSGDIEGKCNYIATTGLNIVGFFVGGSQGDLNNTPGQLGFTTPSSSAFSVDRIVVKVRCDGSSSYSGFIYCWYSVDNGSTWTEVTDSYHRVGWRTNYIEQEWRSFSIPDPTYEKLQQLRIKFDIDSVYMYGVEFKVSRILAVVEYTPNTTISFTGAPLSGETPLVVSFTPTVTNEGTDEEWIMWDYGDLNSTNNYENDTNAVDHTYTSTLHSVGAHYSGTFDETFPGGGHPAYLYAHSEEVDYIETTGPAPASPQLRYPLDNLNFGEHTIFESGVSETLTIYNDGDGDLTISAITFLWGDTPVFDLWSGYSPPIVVPAFGSTEVTVDFLDTFPGPTGSWDATYRVSSDDLAHPEADFVCTISLVGASPTFSSTLMRHLKYFSGGSFAGCLLDWRRSEE